MADSIVTKFRVPVGGRHPIEIVELVPSGKGIFDVEVDGELVFSKYKAGRHVEPGEVEKQIGLRLGK